MTTTKVVHILLAALLLLAFAERACSSDLGSAVVKQDPHIMLALVEHSPCIVKCQIRVMNGIESVFSRGGTEGYQSARACHVMHQNDTGGKRGFIHLSCS